MSNTLEVGENDAGESVLHIRSAGERDLSAPIPYGEEGMTLTREIAEAAGLEVEDVENGMLVSIPPGA